MLRVLYQRRLKVIQSIFFFCFAIFLKIVVNQEGMSRNKKHVKEKKTKTALTLEKQEGVL